MSIEEHLRKLELKDGDVLLIGPQSGIDPRSLLGLGLPHVLILEVQDVDDVRVLSSADLLSMREWIDERIPTLEKRARIKTKKWLVREAWKPKYHVRNIIGNWFGRKKKP